MHPLQRQMQAVLLVHTAPQPARAPVSDIPARMHILLYSVLFARTRHISDPDLLLRETQPVAVLAGRAIATLVSRG